jgi:hypothetical protein
MEKKIFYYTNKIVIWVNDPDFGEPHDVVMEDANHSTPDAKMTTPSSTPKLSNRSVPPGKTRSFATSIALARLKSP